MPHEHINSPVAGRMMVLWKPGSGDEMGTDFEPGYVQLMTEDPDTLARTPMVEHVGEGNPDGSESVIRQVLNYDKGTQFTGYAVNFSRDDLNYAIRMLRRARDSAFGRDA